MTDDEDERLAAWLDGALSPEEAEAFAAALDADPALAAKAEAWRANDQALAGAFFAAERPIDDALIARLGLASVPVAANDNPRRSRLGWLAAGSALAASLVAALVFTVRTPAPGDDLSAALERTASLASVQLADGRTLTPLLTVRAADGRWCREFRSGGETALACRKDAGRWTIEAHGQTAAGPDAGSIAMAGGADPAPLDAAYRRLGASDPVSAEQERALIGKGWN
jgi:anti-sigma factor RsiW